MLKRRNRKTVAPSPTTRRLNQDLQTLELRDLPAEELVAVIGGAAIGGSISYRMFNPQPEPPGRFLFFGIR